MKKRPFTNDKKKSSGPKLPPAEKIKEDADDLAHEREEEEPTEIGEADPDDVVHRSYKPRTNKENDMEDPDDLVHGYPEDEEE